MCQLLQSDQVFSHVTQAVEVTADAAQVTEGGQQSVEPQTAAQLSVFGVRLTQLGVRFAVGRLADVLTQTARLLDEVHVGHDVRGYLTEPLSVDCCHHY